MLPLSPSTPFTRSHDFIREEWDVYFNTTSPYPAPRINGGWKGILYGNLACIDPKAAWQFFSQQDFDGSWIDGGASRTWYLAFAAGKYGPSERIYITVLTKSQLWAVHDGQSEYIIGKGK